MSRNVRAAAMIMGGVPVAESPSPDDAALLASYSRSGIGAFLLPGFLLRQPERLAALASTARSAGEGAGLGRVLVAIGGYKLPAYGLPPFPSSPTPLGLASSLSKAAARRAGRLLGSTLAACGVDMVLAPRLDLASDPKDPVGALEGFGEDGRLAGALGAAFSQGLARSGVGACVGRFPGLGSVCRDPYESMPFVALPVERLERCEMRPFARAIGSGAPAVMVGRVLVPSLEAERIPASASSRVIEGRLREALGFRGIVIGDDAGSDEEPGKAAVLGALAGCDLCLYSRPEAAFIAAAALETAVSKGELPSIRVETSRRRLSAFFERKARKRNVPPSERRLRQAMRDIEDGVSVLRGSLAFGKGPDGDFRSAFVLVFLPPRDAPDAPEAEAVLSALRAGLPGAELLGLDADSGPGETEALAARLSPRGRYAQAAVLSYDAHFRPAQEGLARLIEEFVPSYRVVAMRDPYDAAFFPNAQGLGAAYGFSEAAARAVAGLLAGSSKASGGNPVEVIGLEI
jgi:beta-N-acetylhexosaminidase